jgi:hypothetical protein
MLVKKHSLFGTGKIVIIQAKIWLNIPKMSTSLINRTKDKAERLARKPNLIVKIT